MRQESISPDARQRLANLEEWRGDGLITEREYRDTRLAILMEDDSREAWREINAALPQKHRHHYSYSR